MLERVRAGQKIRRPSAADENAKIDAAADYIRRMGGTGGTPPSSRRPPPFVVKNMTAADRRKGEVMQVGDNLLETLDDEYFWFEGAVPGSPPKTIGILIEESPEDALTELVVFGRAFALVDVTSDLHTFARPVADSHILVSSFAGPVQLFWKPSGETGEQECVVILGGSFSQLWVGKTAGGGLSARSGDTPGTGTVTLQYRNTTSDDYADLLDADDAPVVVTVRNNLGAVGGSIYVTLSGEAFGDLLVIAEDCS